MLRRQSRRLSLSDGFPLRPLRVLGALCGFKTFAAKLAKKGAKSAKQEAVEIPRLHDYCVPRRVSRWFRSRYRVEAISPLSATM